jgi:hypothetical protein
LNASGKPVAYGAWPSRDIPIGKNIPLGKVSADLSKLPAPAQYKLMVTVDRGLLSSGLHNIFLNDWNFWLYPAQVSTATPSDVLATHNWSEAATNLAAGGKVLFMPGAADLDPAKCPPMKNIPVFWNIQMTVRPPANPTPKFDAMLGLLCDTNHPALAEFPTEANCDWQWTELVNNVRSVNLSKAPLSQLAARRDFRVQRRDGTAAGFRHQFGQRTRRPGVAATAPFPAGLHGRK